MANAFFSARSHGFVRVAACTPAVAIADPMANAEETLRLARDGDSQGVDLMVFPELGISAYAIDDLFLQDTLLQNVEKAIDALTIASKQLGTVLMVGAPLGRNGRIYNCAIAIADGRILGVIPKSFLPNYREYYENRWFAPGAGLSRLEIDVAGRTAPFGTDLIFAAENVSDFVFHAEMCEDFWAASPPSTRAALAGATILCNLSASNIVIGKADDRALLCASQSMRCHAAYIYSAAGPGESTTDLAWDGQATIHELGVLLAQTDRFPRSSQMTVADIDVERLRLERMRTPTFNNAAAAAGHPETTFRTVRFVHSGSEQEGGLRRPADRFPYVPDDESRLANDCFEAFNIQVQGLAKRIVAAKARHVVIGVSGGLDSALALVVAAKAFDALGRPRTDILAFTLPGFATGETTKGNAWRLMHALGVTGEEIDIKPAAARMLADLKHPFSEGRDVFDVTFENVQAGLRTDYLFRLANQRNGLVLGTGNLSELALGWCTYGVGDHMSHYNANASVPKTLIRHLVRWTANARLFGDEAASVLLDILGTVVSPELVPQQATGALQDTEQKIGPYELHDFTLYYVTRYGLRPSKIAFLAWNAWRDRETGLWPAMQPQNDRNQYDIAEIKKWLRIFLHRFFETSQFKRSALPNGPKVVAGGSLSPRGDWRAPSDGAARIWLNELEENVP